MAFFDLELFEQLRRERGVTWGRPVRAHEVCGSTNDLALREVDSPAKTGIVHIAREQTQGRGRRGRSWVAPAGECLMFSVMLRYPATQPGLSCLSLATGLALVDLVEPLLDASARGENGKEPGPRAQIKWPNDLYVADRKLAGVLVETRRSRDQMTGVVIGIGLNVHVREFPPELSRATSLCLLGVESSSFESLLVDLLGCLERRVLQFLKAGCAGIARDVSRVDYLRDRPFLLDGQSVRGAGIDEGGRLLVTDDRGQLRAIDAGQVELFP